MTSDQELDQVWWETRYRDGHAPWDREGTSPALHHWLDTGILTRGRVLVPGCGRGHEVVQLARLGYEVTALDIAPTAIAFLTKQLKAEGLRAEVVHTDVFAWQPTRRYDVIYEQTSLCALPPAQWPEYVDRLHRWLRPGGDLFALFMQTGRPGGPPFHCELSTMKRLFPPERWQWPRGPALEVPHSVGFVEKGYVLRRLADRERQ